MQAASTTLLALVFSLLIGCGGSFYEPPAPPPDGAAEDAGAPKAGEGGGEGATPEAGPVDAGPEADSDIADSSDIPDVADSGSDSPSCPTWCSYSPEAGCFVPGQPDASCGGE